MINIQADLDFIEVRNFNNTITVSDKNIKGYRLLFTSKQNCTDYCEIIFSSQSIQMDKLQNIEQINVNIFSFFFRYKKNQIARPPTTMGL